MTTTGAGGMALLLAFAICAALLPAPARAAPACDHQWDEGEVVRAATCTAEGVRQYTCAGCGQIRTEAIPEASHIYNGRVEIKTEPSCSKAGSQWVYCSVCGDASHAHTVEQLDPLPHTFDPADPGVVSREPNCSKAGVLLRTCTVCESSAQVSIPALPHAWDCDSDGGYCVNCSAQCRRHNYGSDGACVKCGYLCAHNYTNGQCSICRFSHSCSESDKLTLPKVPATETAPGLTQGVICGVCGKVWVAQAEIPIPSDCRHTQTCVKTTKAPTECVPGEEQVVCSNEACGQVLETRAIPRSHDWTQRVTSSQRLTVCRTCGAVSQAVPLPTPLEPSDALPSGGAGQEKAPAVIDDPSVPLAGAPQLNTTEHFAYITGYEDGTVRPLDNMTRAEAAVVFYRLMTDAFRAANQPSSSGFPDVDPEAWYGGAIATCAQAGIVFGYEDGSYRPGQFITRAEFTAFAAALLDDGEGDAAEDFADTAGHWAAPAIRRAVQAGWVQGSGGLFRPDELITRAEAITIFNRMLGRTPSSACLLPGMRAWSDNPEGTWYYEAIQEATNGHGFRREADGSEVWEELLESPDWDALETERAQAAG